MIAAEHRRVAFELAAQSLQPLTPHLSIETLLDRAREIEAWLAGAPVADAEQRAERAASPGAAPEAPQAPGEQAAPPEPSAEASAPPVTPEPPVGRYEPRERPAPLAVLPPREQSKKWSHDRHAVLRAGWADGLDDRAIRVRVNALPGPPITSDAAITAQAYSLRLGKRGGISRDGHPSVTAGMLSEEPAAPVTWDVVCEWGRRRGVVADESPNPADLAKVNQARAAAGLPSFSLIPHRGRRLEKLPDERTGGQVGAAHG